MNTATSSTLRQATSFGSAAVLIEKALRSCGVDPGEVFHEAGIDFEEACLPEARIPSTRVHELHRLSVRATGDPCFGLKVAAEMQPANLHGLGFAWLASDSLREALERLVRFSKLISNVIRFGLEATPQSMDLVVRDLERLPGIPDSSIDSAMAVLLRMCRITAGNAIDPLRVDLTHSRPSCASEFDQLFRAPVNFGAADNRMCFDKSVLETHLTSSNPELARINDQAVIEYLARFDRNDMAMQVRTRLIERLPAGTPRQDEIARDLNISLRSMQRRLQDAGTSYRELLDRTRSELAMHYVRETHRQLGEVAYLLGFSEPGSFTRAFRRWTGASPLEYRER